MRYGHFDDKNREYVIENPDTPMSWVNYMGTADYCGIVSNNAAGYAFFKSAKSTRMLRMRFNSIPTDRPGRYLYLRDNASGDYWSATWQPVAKPLSKYKTVCRHGQGYSRFISRYNGIRTNYRVFVPIDKPLEFWEVEIENTSKHERDLSLFAYAEWCFWDMTQDLTNFQYILYTCNMSFEKDTIDYTSMYVFWNPKAFFTSILPVESFDTDRDVFIGAYRHEGQPKALENGRCANSIAVGGSPCAAVQNRIKLKPGEKKYALFIVGMGDAKTVGQECRARYSDRAQVDAEFAKLQEYWRERLSKFGCKTPSAEVNSMGNIWNQYQCHTTFNWSRSASFNEAGGRDGLGFRDTNQDCLGVVHAIPQLVRRKILDLFKGQHSDGAAMHTLQPLTWKQGPHNRDEKDIYSDDHLWLLISVTAYLKETLDMPFLDEVAPYADAGQASVYEHLKQALEFSWTHRGPHGVCLGLRADWNDCINLRGKGESMFSTFLFYRALSEMITLAKRLGRTQDVERCEAYRTELKRAIDGQAWDGEWYLRGFLDSGRKLGSKDGDQAKIFINSQTWAVVSGCAETAKAVQCMDSLHKYLATEHGVVKNFPAYSKWDQEVGAITTFPKGLKENAAIFCHANTWAVVAEGILGRGDHAFKLYRAFLPAAQNDSAEVYTMEPYVYCQFITGKEHPYKFGRARNSWLTGTASWAFVALSQYILGVRADYDGLVVSPSIPSEWKGYEVTRVYRGATYQIKVKNPDHVCAGVRRIKVDGKRIEGNRLPIAPAGATVNVEVVLGK